MMDARGPATPRLRGGFAEAFPCWLAEASAKAASPGMTSVLPPSHPALQRLADFIQHLGILDGRWHGPGVAVGDLLDGAPQDFSRPRFRQAPDRDRELEGCDGPDFLADQ